MFSYFFMEGKKDVWKWGMGVVIPFLSVMSFSHPLKCVHGCNCAGVGSPLLLRLVAFCDPLVKEDSFNVGRITSEFLFFFLPEHSFVKCFPHNWWQMSASVCCLLHISKWHVCMSSRIKCCSQAFCLLKCLHAVFHVCGMEGNLHGSQFTSIFWREKHKEQLVSFTSTGTLNSILKQLYYNQCFHLHIIYLVLLISIMIIKY